MLGPILSGLIGAVVAVWVAALWSRWVPVRVGQKGREQLLKQYGATIRVANVLAWSGFCIAILCYWSGWLNRNDWRGLGLGAGLASFLPVAYMVTANASRGADMVRECLVTYAISQKTPMSLLFTVMGLFFVAGLVAAVSLFL